MPRILDLFNMDKVKDFFSKEDETEKPRKKQVSEDPGKWHVNRSLLKKLKHKKLAENVKKANEQIKKDEAAAKILTASGETGNEVPEEKHALIDIRPHPDDYYIVREGVTITRNTTVYHSRQTGWRRIKWKERVPERTAGVAVPEDHESDDDNFWVKVKTGFGNVKTGFGNVKTGFGNLKTEFEGLGRR